MLFHRVLQGAAQRGPQFYIIFAVLRTLFFMQQNEPFLLQNLHPRQENPLKHHLVIVAMILCCTLVVAHLPSSITQASGVPPPGQLCWQPRIDTQHCPMPACFSGESDYQSWVHAQGVVQQHSVLRRVLRLGF